MAPQTTIRRISVIARKRDLELSRIHGALDSCLEVDGRGELEDLLGQLLAAVTVPPATSTLDLIGHSGPDALLELGDWRIDAETGAVTSFFRGLADHDVFRRLGIGAVRLLGCETARTRRARSTITVLAEVAGVEFYGTRTMIYAAHYEPTGFSAEHLLIPSGEMSRTTDVTGPAISGNAWPLLFDIEALPSSSLGALPYVSWPRRIATTADAGALLALIRRGEGGLFPGLLAAPMCEVVVPATEDGRFWRIQVLLDGAMVRVYTDDQDPGVCFPTSDPSAMRAAVTRLPALVAG